MANMRTIFSLSLLFVLASVVTGQSPGTAAPEAVEHTLGAKEQDLERLYAEYWQIQYRLEQGDTTVSDKDVEAKLRAVFNDPPFLAALKAAHFTTPILQRRQELFLEAAADSQISTDAKLAATVESIRKDSSAMRYHIGGKALGRPELDNALAHSANRDIRRQAWFSMGDLTKATGTRIREVMRLRNELGPRFSGKRFTDLMLERRATKRHELAAVGLN